MMTSEPSYYIYPPREKLESQKSIYKVNYQAGIDKNSSNSDTVSLTLKAIVICMDRIINSCVYLWIPKYLNKNTVVFVKHKQL